MSLVCKRRRNEPLNTTPPRTFTVVLHPGHRGADRQLPVGLCDHQRPGRRRDHLSLAAGTRPPGPMRMCVGFIVMMTVFTARCSKQQQWMSRRQLKRIDEMEDV